MKFYQKWFLAAKNYFKNLLTADLSPGKIAFSFAAGIFVGIVVPEGFQTFGLIPFVILFKCNFPIAWGATLITNPATLFPIYYTADLIGEKLTGLKLSMDKIGYIIKFPTLGNICALGHDALIVMFTGAFVLGIFLSVISYYLIIILITRYREKFRQH